MMLLLLVMFKTSQTTTHNFGKKHHCSPPTTHHSYYYSITDVNTNTTTRRWVRNNPTKQPSNQANQATNLPCAGSRTFHVSRCGTAGARPPPGSVGSTRGGGGRSHYLADSATRDGLAAHAFVATVYALLATELPRGRGDVRLPFPGCYERGEGFAIARSERIVWGG